MRALPRTLLPLTAALLLASTSLQADELRFQDGSTLVGQLVTVILQDTGGQVHVVPRERLMLATVASQPVPIQPLASGGWGSRGEVAPAAWAPATRDRPRFTIELNYEDVIPTPENTSIRDPGEQGEVFVYKAVQAGDRASWIRVGSVRRVENEVIAHFTPEEECNLLHQLVFDSEKTREEIVVEVEERRTFTHRMRYEMNAPMNFRPGTWTVYLNFPQLKRHKIWNNVVFHPNRSQHLSYAWSSHSSFGR